MKKRFLTALAVLVGMIVTGLLVAASIWPVVNVVETGKTPQYPKVQPQYYTATVPRVFTEAKGSVLGLHHWTLVSVDPAKHTIHARHHMPVLGLVDDVTVTVAPVTEFVTQVNVRSASSFGKGDFGQNARNIRAFFAELDGRLGAVKFNPHHLSDAPPGAETSGQAPKKEHKTGTGGPGPQNR